MADADFHGIRATEVVARQLGRPASIQFVVRVKCPYKWPAVIENRPINSAGKPNPNLYYLTCPYLVRHLSRLEDRKFSRTFKRIINEDARLLKILHSAQRKHARIWHEMASGQSCRKGAEGPLIAGARDETHIKCLHAHFAYYLAHPEYEPGKIIATKLGEIWCRDQQCKKFFETDGQG